MSNLVLSFCSANAFQSVATAPKFCGHIWFKTGSFGCQAFENMIWTFDFSIRYSIFARFKNKEAPNK